MNANEIFQVAWQLTVLALSVYSFVFCLRVAGSRGPMALAKYLAVFAVMAVFAMRVLPLVADYMIANTMDRMQNGYAGKVVAQTANNTLAVMGKAVSGVSMPTLPEVAPVAPVGPATGSVTAPQTSPTPAPIESTFSATPISNAPATIHNTASTPDYATAAPTAQARNAPATTWSSGLGTDSAGNAYEGPAAPANYAPLGTDENSNVIQGPVAPSWFGSPTIKTITGKPDGGPSIAAANANVWGLSPTVQTITRYQVQRGDTMHKIALSHYGDGNKWRDICQANPMPNCNRIHAGMVLTLP